MRITTKNAIILSHTRQLFSCFFFLNNGVIQHRNIQICVIIYTAAFFLYYFYLILSVK